MFGDALEEIGSLARSLHFITSQVELTVVLMALAPVVLADLVALALESVASLDAIPDSRARILTWHHRSMKLPPDAMEQCDHFDHFFGLHFRS